MTCSTARHVSFYNFLFSIYCIQYRSINVIRVETRPDTHTDIIQLPVEGGELPVPMTKAGQTRILPETSCKQ